MGSYMPSSPLGVYKPLIITCKPHSVNLIGVREFRNATSSSPRNCLVYTRPFPSLRVGSGNETNDKFKKKTKLENVERYGLKRFGQM